MPSKASKRLKRLPQPRRRPTQQKKQLGRKGAPRRGPARATRRRPLDAFAPARGLLSLLPSAPTFKFADTAFGEITCTACEATGTFRRVAMFHTTPYNGVDAGRMLNFATASFTNVSVLYNGLGGLMSDVVAASGTTAGHYRSAYVRRVCTTISGVYRGRDDECSGRIHVCPMVGQFIMGSYDATGRDALITSILADPKTRSYPTSMFKKEQRMDVPCYHLGAREDFDFRRATVGSFTNTNVYEFEGPGEPCWYSLAVVFTDWDAAQDGKNVLSLTIRTHWEILPETTGTTAAFSVTPNKPGNLGAVTAEASFLSNHRTGHPRPAREHAETS